MGTRFRSLLFVPAHKPEWIDKAIAANPDGVIVDLEDSVPASRKSDAREYCSANVTRLFSHGKAAFVRVNGWGSGDLLADLLSLGDALPTGIMLPKVESRRDLSGLDRVLGELEAQHGVPTGSVEIMPTFESVKGLANVGRLCRSSDRILRCPGGPTHNPNGDTARSLGVRWSERGDELLYVHSKAILEAKASGALQVFGGMTSDVGNLAALRRTAERARSLGCFGSIVIHPSHVPIVNEIFLPTTEEIAEAHAIVAAMRVAVAAGDAATLANGKMVDIAHARSAVAVLREAAAFGMDKAEPVDVIPGID